MIDLYPHRFASIPELGKLLRSGQTTAVELTKFYLKRCETLGAEYNCVVTLTRELAIKQARQADRELAEGKDRGPLHGIPYGLKDLVAVRGYPTTWGAQPFRNRILDEDATIYKKLTEAGAILVAKLSMVVLAGGVGYSSPTNTFSGTQMNPWKKKVRRWLFFWTRSGCCGRHVGLCHRFGNQRLHHFPVSLLRNCWTTPNLRAGQQDRIHDPGLDIG